MSYINVIVCYLLNLINEVRNFWFKRQLTVLIGCQLQTLIKDNMLTVLQTQYAANDLSTSQISTAFNYLFMSVSVLLVLNIPYYDFTTYLNIIILRV